MMERSIHNGLATSPDGNDVDGAHRNRLLYSLEPKHHARTGRSPR